MSEVVSYRLEGDIGVIGVDYPPVNALGQGVRAKGWSTACARAWKTTRPKPWW